MIIESVVNFILISIVLAWYPPEQPQLLNGIYLDQYPMNVYYDQDPHLDRHNHPHSDHHSPDDGSVDDTHSPDNEEITFDDIYGRRKAFDVENPMDFPTESKPESEELNDDQLHASDPNDYNLHATDPDPYANPNAPPDDYASESQTETKQPLLSDGCLRCLCEASSDCDPQVRCHVEGSVDYSCGPFQINPNYWNDAGSPGADNNDPMDFEECMNDIECSIDTVNSYMKMYSKDCDDDGRVSCDDYAKIHKAGHQHCNSSWILDTEYWSKYKDCFFEYR